MTELRTLKDFECSDQDEYGCCSSRKEGDSPHAVEVNELKQEAIKWVKVIRGQIQTDDPYHLWTGDLDAKEEVLMSFFNITEAGLLAYDALEYAKENDDLIYKNLTEEELK